MITVGTTVVSGSPINGGGGGAGLPAATGAGEVPISTGAGTTYAASPFSTEVGTAVGGFIGAVSGQAFIGNGAGIATTTSADVSSFLAAANAAAARTALAFPVLSTPLYVLRMNGAGTAMEFAAAGDVMTSDHSWNRPSPTAVALGARFLSIDDLTVQVSTGVAATANVDASGWVQDLPTGLAADRCGLTPGTISAQSLDLHDYALGSLTMAVLFKPSGTLSGGAVGCIGALGDTTSGTRGLALFLKERTDAILGSVIDIVAYTGALPSVTTIVTNAFSAASTSLHAVAVAAVAGNIWRVSVDGGAVADVVMATAYATPTTTDSVGFGSRFNSTNPFLGQVIDMMVWQSLVSSADMPLLTTLPATPTYALPESASTGAATIRIQANRWDPCFPTTLRARGLPGGVALVCATVAKVSF